jgi:hypothetical protein
MISASRADNRGGIESASGRLDDMVLHTIKRERVFETLRIRMFAVEGYPACGTPFEAPEFSLRQCGFARLNSTKFRNTVLKLSGPLRRFVTRSSSCLLSLATRVTSLWDGASGIAKFFGG